MERGQIRPAPGVLRSRRFRWSKRGGGVRGFVGLFTLTLALSHRGRGDGSGAGIRSGVPLTLTLSHVGERGFLHRPAALGIPCGRIAARRGHIYLHFWVVY